MPFIRSLTGFTPPRRYDLLPFTSALIRESATLAGTYTTIDTKTITPVDTDPANPASRNFTTSLGTVDPAYYLIRWRDASLATFDSDPVLVSASSSSVNLCTLADVKALMQKTGVNAAAQDTLISSLITRASVKVMAEYDREFVPGGPNALPAVGATRTFEYPWADQNAGEALVSLAPYDLQTSPVPTVIADTDQTSALTLTTGEYRLSPQPAVLGVYSAIKIFPLGVSFGVVGWRSRRFTVTGNWGFPTIPSDVVQATAETVIHWLTAYPAAGRPDQQDFGQAVVAPRSLPMSAVDLLRRFQRMT